LAISRLTRIDVLVYLVIILAFAADRLTKVWAAGFLAENGVTKLNDVITVTETYNRGLAFGAFQGAGSIAGWLSIIVILGLLIYLKRLPTEMRLVRLGLALIIGGALGNMVDRILAGQVLDFIMTPIRPGVFNVADVCINLGIVIGLAGFLLHKPESESALNSSPAESDLP
jgi:signal peptidase II